MPTATFHLGRAEAGFPFTNTHALTGLPQTSVLLLLPTVDAHPVLHHQCNSSPCAEKPSSVKEKGLCFGLLSFYSNELLCLCWLPWREDDSFGTAHLPLYRAQALTPAWPGHNTAR